MSYEDGMPAGGNSRFRGYPARMSERQQLALLLQMTSQEPVSGGNRTENTSTSNTTSRSSTLQQRGSKGRWTSKNGESAVQASINRKEDFRVRQMLVNGFDLNVKEANDITGASSPDESTTVAPDSPCSPAETSASAPSNEQQEQEQQQLYQHHHSQFEQQQQRTTGSAPAAAPHVAEDSGAPCEMRRTPPQNKVDRSGTGQSGSSPRVTLRLNQVRGARDEKKGGSTNSRQGGMNAQSQGQMENSSKSSTNVSSGTVNAASGPNASGNTSSAGDTGDVYEFKSSKEPTPVRGLSSSPNPHSEKDKDGNKSASGQGSQSNGNNASTAGSTTASSGETTSASISTDDAPASVSPSAKRAFESDNVEEQDEENRRKKRKDSEPVKENLKSNPTGRQSTGRNAANSGEKCTKSGKQGSGTSSNKNNQNTASISADRKSPSASSMASSPKPSNSSGSASNSKTTTPAPPESDGEDDRSKGSDSNSAPKVPPLKIVIPQSTVSEQEQGNRNGKNTSNRSHQLPYVVASSNSNDSTDKDQNQSQNSGTTSPTEGGNNTKNEDKKDFSGALHGEERSTHHQRVLRSSHRSGNGSNGSANLKENSSSGNGNYSNSSPLPAAAAASSMDRSNNSSPQQRHHSPTPESAGSELSKNSSTESSNSGASSKTNVMAEKSEKNNESGGKSQKDSGSENSDNTSTTTSSTTNVGAPPLTVELHPRKRKMKPNKEAQQAATATNEASETTNTGPEVHPHDQPITNCYQLYLNIRKQIDRRRKGLFPVQPKPPQGFKDYLMNRCTYVLAGNANKEPTINPPVGLLGSMKDLYIEQEKDRYRLRMQHVVEKEKLVLSVEQEILRVHGRAARALANQSVPFSVCTILKDEEVYNVITPEQEEKDRNARSRYNGRLFLSWLQDVDDKWEKIKESMLLRHHNEAESLHAVQKMAWEWNLKDVGLCDFKATPQIEDINVPMVHVSDDFDLLPA